MHAQLEHSLGRKAGALLPAVLAVLAGVLGSGAARAQDAPRPADELARALVAKALPDGAPPQADGRALHQLVMRIGRERDGLRQRSQ